MTYPNLAGKHAHDAFITPAANIAYIRSRGLLDGYEPPDGIVMCYQRSFFEDCVRGEVSSNRGFRGMVTLPSTDHRVALLGDFGYGAPVAAMRVEDFIELGTRKFISIGTAGSLQPHCGIGDLVVCERAIRDEGVSHHYLAPGKYASASADLTGVMSAELDRRGTAYTIGTAWTIDTPYRETVEEARHYQREGVACVEMEAAALFAVGTYRDAHVASAFVISDSLAEAVWEPQFHSDATAAGLRTLYDAAVAALSA